MLWHTVPASQDMRIWCECSSFYKLNSYISNTRFPQWSSHLHSDTAEASLCRALGQKWALSLNWQPQSHFLPFSGYTLFLHALYPSSTVHAADSTWKLSYILPRALETNQYSHSGVLIAPQVCCEPISFNCVYLIKHKLLHAPCENINWHNNGLKPTSWHGFKIR